MAQWARFGLLAVLVSIGGQSAAALWFGHAWHHVWNQIQIYNATGEQVTPVYNVSSTRILYFYLFYLAAFGVSIGFLIWQHAAATAARGFGYPARISPALGVGSWFIPVVNLWFPYWALSDCLPPGHALRGRCLWAWLAYVGSGITAGATFVVALVSTSAAVVPIVIAGAFALAALGLGVQLIRAVTDDHQRQLAGRLAHGPLA